MARDGSFARSYVDFAKYENDVNCKVAAFEISCFNEWAKNRNNDGVYTKREPYRIAKLEVTMLFIPRTSETETLPRSIKMAMEEARMLKNLRSVKLEGYLSQQGGDCRYWKRRYFKLKDLDFIAHNESNMKPRANINLSKAVKIINSSDDIETGQRAEQFKVKFLNGEIIDFTADNLEEKMEWVQALQKVVGQNAIRSRQPWIQLLVDNEIPTQDQ